MLWTRQDPVKKQITTAYVLVDFLGLSEVTGQAREDAAVTAGDSCHGWDWDSS